MRLSHSLIILLLLSIHSFITVSATLETYIVHVESPDELDDEQIQLSSTTGSSGLSTREDLERWYHSFLPAMTTTADTDSTMEGPEMVYCYHNVIKGFAARLSLEHVKAMENKPGFVSAKPQKVLFPQTTHTPYFLGLHKNTGLWRKSNYGKGVIIGIMDTGIFPDHPSFSDKGMPPPPAKWKGQCEFMAGKCNNKLIGARSFAGGKGKPGDQIGHGTHVAGTAAGNFVNGANVFGNANGTAAGIAPLAHIASYKVCSVGCPESDILAGMEAAIEDGVDIISLSLSGREAEPFYNDNVAPSAYKAIQKGIFVSCSAGNDGPESATVLNGAPWVLTVGASSTDRKFSATAVLGNNVKLPGQTLYQPRSSRQHPLFYPGLNKSDENADRFCTEKLLNITEVKGKIVVCEVDGIRPNTVRGRNVKAAGGVGMIIINSERYQYTVNALNHVLPATHISYADGEKLITYMKSTSSPTVSLTYQGTIIGDSEAPEVAAFSSRGPNNASLGILKPDILGPGVNIVSASNMSVGTKVSDKSNYFMSRSGTSMSCPHLSGVAALLKSAHPDWSPAAIKSAIMTTADNVNLGNNPIVNERKLPADLFATGSGQVNPTKANDPGLVYDLLPEDYIPYLCGLKYKEKDIRKIVNRKIKCTKSIPEAQLNYPSFAIRFGGKVQEYTRTVTNVGKAKSVYRVEVVSPPGVKVTVKPQKLVFSKVDQKLSYKVSIILVKFPKNTVVSPGSVTWKSRKYSVRIPIAATLGS